MNRNGVENFSVSTSRKIFVIPACVTLTSYLFIRFDAALHDKKQTYLCVTKFGSSDTVLWRFCCIMFKFTYHPFDQYKNVK